jgi:glucuronate isomerase
VKRLSSVVVMGVSGVGKTLVGRALADALGWRFVDGDDHHPSANVAKMRAGIPLDDVDRAPWLAALRALLDDADDRGEGVVLACSALKARYRERLGVADARRAFVFLDAPRAVIEGYLMQRQHQYMPATLLDSQLAALEVPTDAIRVDTSAAPPAVLAQALDGLRALDRARSASAPRRAGGTMTWTLDPDRCFAPEATQRDLARDLYAQIADLPLVCPHGHVPPALLLDDAPLGDPASVLVVPDHYVVRMLHSQGVPMEDLGVPQRGRSGDPNGSERDPRAIWRRFCAHFHLFAGTPTGLWLKDELITLFGVTERPNAANADALYDQLVARLARDDARPRALFARQGIEVLTTTDAATDPLEAHAALQAAGMNVRPTFRPDAAIDPTRDDWRSALALLEERTNVTIDDYASYLTALRSRRDAFRALGATATDHGMLRADAEALDEGAAARTFAALRAGAGGGDDAARFASHMLFTMARMSADDGLVMQIHAGSLRNHHTAAFERFGLDIGADIPVATEWTRALRPLLSDLGAHPNFRLILFTLDESSYARELAPLAGHYPAVRLGAPWWFFDSVLGMERYLDATVETAGVYNLAGFVDDTRAFPSIRARHDVWRRVSSNWLAGRVARGLIDPDVALGLARHLAYDAAKGSYRL